jgi:hypothetical protein
MSFAFASLLAALVAQASPTPSPTPNAPVYFGKPAVRMTLQARPLGFDPDGNARWLVVTQFFDAQGKPTRIMANSNIDYESNDGYLQWQTRLAYGQPAAILHTTHDGPLTMTVRATQPNLGAITVHTDTRRWSGARAVAEALGPHMVQIGWFPEEQKLVRIYRVDTSGNRRLLADIAGPSSSYRDADVAPELRYRYVVQRAGYPPVKLGPIAVPPEPPKTSIANVTGKGMWLFFTSNPLDPVYYRHLNPNEIVDQAVRAGLHYVELRVAYGAYWEITPEAKPTIDAIIDGLAARHIGTIGWTVPRDETFEDLQTSVRAAYYRTANGTPLAGLALDVERGEEFMGDAPQGLDALWHYVEFTREALGPNYLLVPNVEDPYLERLDNTKYPYAQIARFSNALQPMTYWRMLRHRATTPQEVQSIVQSSYDTLLRDAGRTIPISIGGQTSAEGPGGNPPADEITASLAAAAHIGALGECFFDWDGTQPDQWSAIGNYRWLLNPSM